MGLVQHGFDGRQFHPHGADAGHRVVAMGERHDRAEPAGVNRWFIESVAAVIEVSDGSERVRLRFDRGAGMSTVVVQRTEV